MLLLEKQWLALIDAGLADMPQSRNSAKEMKTMKTLMTKSHRRMLKEGTTGEEMATIIKKQKTMTMAMVMVMAVKLAP